MENTVSLSLPEVIAAIVPVLGAFISGIVGILFGCIKKDTKGNR